MRFSSVVVVSFLAASVLEAAAQKPTPVVRDAIYRGTMVCDKLPFESTQIRNAIEVTVKGDSVRYKRPVVLAKSQMAGYEEGSGSIDGEQINLKGAWSKGPSTFDATYSGNFVRRHAKLTGTQNWTHEGKTYKRSCTGSIKRPLAAFLPREKKN